MRSYLTTVVLGAVLSFHSLGGVSFQVESALGELRGRHRDSIETYQRLKKEIATSDESVEQRTILRLGEFKRHARSLSRIKHQALPQTVAGESMMWKPRVRSVQAAVEAAEAFKCGPKNCVTPSNGEYDEEDVDFAFSERGGLSFSFVRRYASFSEFDCGFGKGWDHDFNSGIVFDADVVADARVCTLFWQGRSIRFEQKNGGWEPETGSFFSMEIGGNKIFLLTPSLLRIEFEPSIERKHGECRWRLSAIASRHDKWKANRIELEYLPKCDRLKSITGVRGERIDFSYDAIGHIVGINSIRKSVRYEYDADRLVGVRYSPVTLAVQGKKTSTPVVTYDYANFGGCPKICRKKVNVQSYALEVSYDHAGRVVRCGYVSKEAEQMWRLSYRQDETIIESPAPSAEVHYFWGGTSHGSLPCRMEIPAQQAVWRYAFNKDYLLTEQTDALGVRIVREYDSKNVNLRMRGNLLAERRLAGAGLPIKWREFGVRTSYEKDIDLPKKVETYQLETNGVEEIVKREMFTYRRGDYSLESRRETGGGEKGGILMRFAYNRYGEIALECDANDNMAVYEYADALPLQIDFDFVSGTPTGGGWLVRKIEDATNDQIKEASRGLNVSSIIRKSMIRNEITRVAPCARETLYAWDCDGNQIREKQWSHERLALYNEKGAVLAEFSSGSGLSLTEYFHDGCAERVLNEFCPGDVNDFRGRTFPFFEGRYSESRFEYDSLGQMTSRCTTDEPIDGMLPKFTFKRYPSGKMSEITNPSGVTRVDAHDFRTGLLVSQSIKGKAGDIPLGRVIERYPNGMVCVCEDQLGVIWTNRLDAFGRSCERVSCLGTVKRVNKDALDRIVESSEFDGTTKYSWNRKTYSHEYGLLESEEGWKSNDGTTGNWIETGRHLYDNAGNEIGTRGVRDESWTYALYDGLGRRVATRDPVGGHSIVVYVGDGEVYSYSVSRSDRYGDKSFLRGAIRVLDGAGRVIEEMPVDSDLKLVPIRHTVNAYNWAGQLVRTEKMGQTTLVRTYNSLGWIVRETTNPLNAGQGEKPVVVNTRFRADGKILERALDNTSLAFVGDKYDDVSAQHVEAPQKTCYRYDEYGRLQETVNPDGLVRSSIFNKHSLPSQMLWEHLTSTSVLRRIEFSYSPLGQVGKVTEGETKRVLQEFSYDGAGRLTKVIDWNGGERISIESQYDTLGQQIESRTDISGKMLPARRFVYDPVQGVSSVSWEGVESGADAFWEKETSRTDVGGRLISITLDSDHDPIARWEYVGQFPERRSIRDASIDTEYAYTPLGELSHQRMIDSFTQEEVGRLAYEYGPQGQMQFASTQLAAVDRSGDYQFATYSHFDDFRRLTGQNAELKIPEQGDWTNEWRRVFGISGRSLADQSTQRMRYDQANNIWVRYQGEEFNGDADKFSKNQTPTFVSSAKPFPNGFPIDRRELASNRETAKATFEKGKLSADVREYDLLGNLVKFKGQYWNGRRKLPVKWKLDYDSLGRLTQMLATSEDDEEDAVVKKGELAGELHFAYDAQNRRIMKQVVDRSQEKVSTNVTFTTYSGTRQGLVFTESENRLQLVEEYLWGLGERELLMAAMTRAEDNLQAHPRRYYFQQDRGFNTILVTKNDAGHRIPVSASSYLGFGENATVARIKEIKSSMGGSNWDHAYNDSKDELNAATWNPSETRPLRFIEVKLHEVRKLSSMTIWGTNNFPRDFLVFVLPEDVDSPDADTLNSWCLKNRNCFATRVEDGYCHGYQKQDSVYSPYKVALGDCRGDRIVIAWDNPSDEQIQVKEIEVVCTPDNPSAIAYAGQWLDRETGLYYQINRYRIAGSDKFISPDPLGFAAGNNLYAYANGNPLEWHDPDGRTPAHLISAVIGAAVGAVFGGGGYALRCWLNGEEFSWVEFGIQTFIGAASGAIAGFTMGAFNPWAGQASASIAQAAWHGAARGAVSGLASGAFSGAADPVIHGVINGDSAGDITEKALKGASVGALSGVTIGAGLGAAAGAYAQWNLQRPTPGAVWRVCRPDENPGKGLVPKDPAATKTLNSHVGSGSRSGYQSQYVSTTKDYATAYKWAQKTPGARIVKIDTSKLSNNVYDFTDPAVREKYLSGRWSNNFAKGSQEVVIEGPVKSEAITEAKFLGFDF